jgi:Glycosyltransferase family 87
VSTPRPNDPPQKVQGVPQGIFALVARPPVGWMLNGFAVASLLLFGVIGVGRHLTTPGDWVLRPDTRVLYVAGRMWLRGQSPYPLDAFVRTASGIDGMPSDFMHSGFGYLPTAAPLCMLLGALPLRAAFYLMLTLNLAAVAAAAFFTFGLVAHRVPNGGLRDSLSWFVPAVVAGNPFTAHVVFQGQTTMIATAAVLGGWYYAHAKPRPALAGVLIACSTIKLQVAMLAVLWVLLERNWKLIVPMVLTGLALIAYPVVAAGGPMTLVRTWVAELSVYSTIPTNAVGFQDVFGIQSLLVASGIHGPSLAVLILPVFALLWWSRERLSPDEVLSLLLSSSCLLVYAHDYDLAALAPLFGCMWKRLALQGSGWPAELIAYPLFFAPQRALRGLSWGAILHWREVVLLAAVIWLLVVAIRRPRPGSSAGALAMPDPTTSGR